MPSHQDIYMSDDVYDMVKALKKEGVNVSEIFAVAIASEYAKLHDKHTETQPKVLNTREEKIEYIINSTTAKGYAKKITAKMNDTELEELFQKVLKG